MSEKELERPLYIDMDFGEALRRYSQTKASEVQPPKGKVRKPSRPGPKSRPVEPASD